MIQFNLLPDVKLEYIKARRQKRLVLLISTVVAGACLAIFVLLVLYVHVIQNKHSNDLSADIATSSKSIEGTKDLDKILTVQNQLKSLTALHNSKFVASRLFGYLKQITPAKATITQLTVDYTTNTMSINGQSDSLDVANTFVDTIKYTSFQAEGSTVGKNAFSQVVLKSFSRSRERATYTISFSFDPAIFSSAQKVTLKVPSIVTTRSQNSQSALFGQATGATSTSGAGQ